MTGADALVVERDVPLPPQRAGRRWAAHTATLLAMKPGESVVLSFARDTIGGRLATARRHGLKLRSQAEGEKTRVWVIDNPRLPQGGA